jgi:hypothetical protein
MHWLSSYRSVMLEYDLGEQGDNKEALATVVDKLLGRHVFQTLRTEMQASSSFLQWIHIFTVHFCTARLHSPELVPFALQSAYFDIFIRGDYDAFFTSPPRFADRV